jgi:hypothetical protein
VTFLGKVGSPFCGPSLLLPFIVYYWYKGYVAFPPPIHSSRTLAKIVEVASLPKIMKVMVF